MFSVKSTLILLPFLTVALHESDSRNPLLGRRLNNTEVNLTTFINHPKSYNCKDNSNYCINIRTRYCLNRIVILPY